MASVGVESSSLTVDGVLVDSYLTRFVWDDPKYPAMSTLREIVDRIHTQVSKIEDDLKIMRSHLGIGIVAHGPLGHRFFGGKAGPVFSQQLFLQLPGIFASGLVLQSKVCGANHLTYSNCNEVESYYRNGNLVDKVSFSKALHFHYTNHCVFKAYFRSDYCGLDLLLGNQWLTGLC